MPLQSFHASAGPAVQTKWGVNTADHLLSYVEIGENVAAGLHNLAPFLATKSFLSLGATLFTANNMYMVDRKHWVTGLAEPTLP